MEELPFTYLHVFPFSPRDGTPAESLPEPVPQRVAGERSRELREIAMKKGLMYRAGRLGEEATVVLEGQSGWALTGDYLRVEVVGRAPDVPGLVSGPLGGSADNPHIDLSHWVDPF